MVLEVIDIRQQEVAPRQQRLHLVLGLDALALRRTTRLDASLVEQLVGHRPGVVDHGRGVDACLHGDRLGSALACATVVSAVRCASSNVRLIVSASSSLADGDALAVRW